ncbi:terminase large subunit domain-containing protein [Thalassococcus sp. S3]|uniref:terminase large subunit domain-containing protein n=1 Tax=Thalassococcus sp. S3 TaxID=2017482 RepID=UPI0010246CCA|nr:terminase family protein [Thalassococcus sp. S3]QBF31508.1 hypothetical protein CFI11_09805 [Thalassococcus sp. S3]
MTAPITQKEWARMRQEATNAIDDIVEEVGLPQVLLPYQAKAVGLLDTVSTQVLFVEKSRRIGMTWALAAYAVLKAARKKSARGMDAMYISYSQEMTREFIDACAMWARAFNEAASETEETIFADRDENGDRSIKAFRIGFASGFEIIALSSAPRSLRGKEGLVIIDEAAFVDSLEELIKAAMAFLIWGGQVVVCSTHDGADNVFNQQIQDILGGRVDYEHLRVDLDEALTDGLYQRICLVKGEEWTAEGEAAWRQSLINFYRDGADEELFCIASQSSGSWLSGPLIQSRMTEETPILRLELPDTYLQMNTRQQEALLEDFLEELDEALDGLDLTLRYAGGFDFGRVADLSVFALLAIEQNLRKRQALCVEMRNVPGDEQKMIIGRILERVKTTLVNAAFDATGMGWTVAEDMGRKFGLREVEDGPGLIMAIKFSQDWYRVNMPPLKTEFEDGNILIAADADHLADLRAVKVVRGIPRVPDLRQDQIGKKGMKRHGDYAIALALADYASRMPWSEYAYEPVGGIGHNSRSSDPFGAQGDTDRPWYRPPLGGGMRGFT